MGDVSRKKKLGIDFEQRKAAAIKKQEEERILYAQKMERIRLARKAEYDALSPEEKKKRDESGLVLGSILGMCASYMPNNWRLF